MYRKLTSVVTNAHEWLRHVLHYSGTSFTHTVQGLTFSMHGDKVI